MAAPSYLRSPFGALKRVKISPPAAMAAVPCQQRFYNRTLEGFRLDNVDVDDLAKKRDIPMPPRAQPADVSDAQREKIEQLRRPRNVEAIFKAPLRRTAEYGIPVCDLQLRTFSIRNMEFFADFAMRAAYYLGLPAKGPIPLPRRVERWTVPASHFIFKKSQENYERVTLKRLIQIQDGHPETVQLWLALLRKHQYHGVGMKANVFEFEKLDVIKAMDEAAQKDADRTDKAWKGFGRRKGLDQSPEELAEWLNDEQFKRAVHSDPPMSRMQHES